MLIRICLAIAVLTGNASWLVAQQNLGTANLAPPQWEVPIPLSWDDDSLCSYGHHALLNSERRCYLLRKNHSTPYMLHYEWKLHRDEVDTSTEPSNRETWTEFALAIQPKLPIKIQRIKQENEQLFIAKHRLPTSVAEVRGFGVTKFHTRFEHRPWTASILSRLPGGDQPDRMVMYQVTREPESVRPYFEGSINCVPHLTARAKTIEALEAKLLEMYCDYITQMVEEDTLQAVNNAKANNPLERASRGMLDIPDIQFGY